jgi:glucosamine-6-phosphate deaminase
MGACAAADIASEIRACLGRQPSVRMIFAAAPSQSEMLGALRLQKDIDWSRVTAFHMDEYLGLAADAPQRFGLWLRRAIFDHLPFAAVHLIQPGDNPDQAAADYAAKLNAAPIDIVCCGIGANGHLAFNDPPADFEDPLTVKVVKLDMKCRQQQVDDRCFARLDDVPTRALTITIPGLARCPAQTRGKRYIIPFAVLSTSCVQLPCCAGIQTPSCISILTPPARSVKINADLFCQEALWGEPGVDVKCPFV